MTFLSYNVVRENKKHIERKIIMTQLNLTLDANKLTDAILNCDLDQVMKSTLVTVLNAYMESERDQ